jgi:hypothetical protein
MTDEEAITKLKEITLWAKDDSESAHAYSDDILLKVVSSEVAKAYDDVIEAAAWWACA